MARFTSSRYSGYALPNDVDRSRLAKRERDGLIKVAPEWAPNQITPFSAPTRQCQTVRWPTEADSELGKKKQEERRGRNHIYFHTSRRWLRYVDECEEKQKAARMYPLPRNRSGLSSGNSPWI